MNDDLDETNANYATNGAECHIQHVLFDVLSLTEDRLRLVGAAW